MEPVTEPLDQSLPSQVASTVYEQVLPKIGFGPIFNGLLSNWSCAWSSVLVANWLRKSGRSWVGSAETSTDQFANELADADTGWPKSFPDTLVRVTLLPSQDASTVSEAVDPHASVPLNVAVE